VVKVGDIAWSYDYSLDNIIEVEIIIDFGDGFFNVLIIGGSQIGDEIIRFKDTFFKTSQEVEKFLEVLKVLIS
jgi:hypothetical protein